MGEVYLGLDPTIGREVAIKTILPSSTGGSEAQQRFEREARAAGMLNHPNLVTIYEFGQDQGVLYIAMEYVKGHDLEELLRDRAIPHSEALEILAQVCDGLACAHRAGIVHRDIKPSNVRVTRDGHRLQAKVMDFGVARLNNSDMTATGMVMGTVSYMAPEYIRTGKPDPRSDLFAVGVMLYESLSGRKPFAGETTPSILYKIVNEAPKPIEPNHLQGLSPAIRRVLERALDKDPEARYQTAEELARDLRAAKDPTWQGHVEEGTQRLAPAATALVPPPPPPAPPCPAPAAPPVPAARPRPSRGPWIALGALGGLALLGLVGGYAVLRRARTPNANLATQEASRSTTEATLPTVTERPTVPEQAPSALPPPTPSTSPATPKTSQAPHSPSTSPEQDRPRTEPRLIDRPERYTPERLSKLEVHERTNLGLVSMSESIQLVGTNPERAIEGFRQALRADPMNANARAWLTAVLLEQGRLPEARREIREARRMNLLGAMQRNLRFRSAFEKARLNQQLEDVD